MRRRTWLILSLLVAVAIAALIAAITIISRPGPDSAEWLLGRAVDEAYAAGARKAGDILAGVAEVQAGAGDISAARRTARDMRQPDPSILTDLLRKAKSLLARVGIGSGPARRMRLSGEQSQAYASIVKAQAEAGDIAGAKDTLGMMKRNGARYPEALAHIVRAQCRAGDLAAGEATARQILVGAERNSTTGVAIRAIAGGWARAKGLESAKAAADRLLKLLVSPEQTGETEKDVGYFNNHIYKAISRALAESGDIEGAIAIAREFDLMAYAAIINAQIEAGDLEAAKATALSMTPMNGRFWAYEKVACALAKAGRDDEALSLCATIDGIDYGTSVYAGLCKASTSVGDLDRARTLIEKMASPWPKAIATRDIAKAQLAAGDIEGAHATMDHCVENVEPDLYGHDTSIRHVLSIYLSIAEAYAAAGDVDGREKCLQMAKDLTQALRNAGSLAEAQARMGDLAGAGTTLAGLGRNSMWEMCRGLRDAAKSYARTRSGLDALVRWIQALPTPQQRAWAYLGAGQGLIEKKADTAQED